MNKIMKKSLSLLLALVMCISLVPSYVFAEGAEEEISAVEEISDSEIETINEFEAEKEVPEVEEQQQVAEEISDAEIPENEIASETDKDASGEEAEEEIAGEETAGETGEKSEASEEETGEETEEETQEKEEEEQEKSEEEEEEKEELLAGQLAIDISYDPIVCGQNTEFTVNVTGATGELKYYLNYIARYDYGERTDIIDPTKMSYQYDNHFNFTFYASGTYEMRVYVMDLGTSPVTNIGKTITIQIDDPNYPTLEQKVKSVAAQCISAGCSTNYEKSLWLHDWLCNNCTYDYSYLYCSAEGAMCRGTGTCEAYHRAYVMLLKEVGITTDRMEGNFHVWTAALLDDGWYQIDVTWDDGASPSSAYDTSHIYFGLNDALMQAVHSEHYVHGGKECNSLANNYFIRTGKIRSFSDAYVEDIKSNISAGEKSFTISKKDSLYEGYDRTIINTLAAYQLQQDTYDVGEDSYTITATYLSDHSGFQIEAEKIIPTYAVTYRANGGSGTVTDTKSPYEENSTVTVLENSFTAPTGKKFNSWNTAADGTGTSYSPDDTFTITSDITLYAIWIDRTYKINVKTYYYSENNKKYYADKEGKGGLICSPAFDAQGYIGWYGSSQNIFSGTYTEFTDRFGLDGVVPFYFEPNAGYYVADARKKTLSVDTPIDKSSTTISIDEYSDGFLTITIEVYFKAQTPTIHYDGNGANYGTMEDQETLIGNVTLNSNCFHKNYCVFNGWSTSPKGDAEFEDGQTVYFSPDFSDTTITLYALWRPAELTITYNGNDADSGEMPDQTYKPAAGRNLVIKKNAFKKEGYFLKKWTGSLKPSNILFTFTDGQNVGVFDNDGTLNLYAVWEPLEHTITYNSLGGDITPETQTKHYKEAVKLSTEVPAKEGYKFKGWATDEEATELQYMPGDTYSLEENLNLYAIWETLYAAKGSCGASALWDIDSNGVLNITGTGAMDDYSAGGAPWADRASEITAIVVAEGITHIGAYAFDNCTNAASVSLPISLESVGEGAFLGLGTTSDLYVFYLGTYDDWSNIKLETGNEILLSAYVLPKTDTPEITLDKEYILMQTRESAKINVTCNPEGYSELVKWECDENAENEKGIEFLTISDGSITANYEGSFTVTATMTVDGIDYSASCRVDVIKDEPEEDVIEVNLLTAKTTVNIYKTDYARISLLPIVPENKVDYYSSLNSKLGSQPVEEGLAIDEAYFKNEATRGIFDLSVVDDRTLEIVPKNEIIDAVYAKTGSIKSAYKSAIIVVIGGREYITQLNGKETQLNITVSKTLPALKAATLKFNSYVKEDTQPIVITGGTVTGLEKDEAAAKKAKSNTGAVPEWIDKSFSIENAKYIGDTKAKTAKLYLKASLDGYNVKLPVTVPVQVTATAPKLTFKPTSITLTPGTADTAPVSYTVTPAVFNDFEKYPVTLASITETVGKVNTTYANGSVLECNVDNENNLVSVSAGEIPKDGKAHTYKVTLAISDKNYSFTVKTTAKSVKPIMSITTSGYIDTAVPNSPQTLTAKLTNFHQNSGEIYNIAVKKYSGKTEVGEVTELFNIKQSGKVFALTEKAAGSLEKNYTYYAEISVDVDKDGISDCSKTQKLNVKWSNPKNVPAGITLKTSGSIDVLRPATAITIKPTYKNLFAYEPKAEDIHIYKTESKQTSECNSLFNISVVNGSFVITQAEDAWINHATMKFKVKMVAEVNGKEISSAFVNLSVKQGTGKITQSTKTVSLSVNDRYDSQKFSLSPSDSAIGGIDHSRDEITTNCTSLKATYLGNNEYAVKWQYSCWQMAWPSDVKAGATKTVKIKVFFEGNHTSTPNATVTVNVKLY